MRSESEEKLSREFEGLSQKMEEELRVEEARLDDEFQKSYKAIDSVSDEEIDRLADRIVGRIKGFKG